ncbi:hypothetical protein OG599_35055 (plasmid) [Streptomyces sp. NBC_01335]|uniref:hypothetical protein n=1 Tax=Streptomyces sp. NBC_01335 TaxID=2903828 RepID=UPI002E0E0D04|nr:hypothetical protein OG599_35055 [Streptomyces sp. NBC_01335]
MFTTPQLPQPAAPTPPAPAAAVLPPWAMVVLVCLCVAVGVMACAFAGFVVLVRPGASGPINTVLGEGGLVVAVAALAVACHKQQ